ncbi:glycoside hydrolase family 127 protein [Pseudobacter ginsenosidimutans]|uniref:glycoside hydrolase family 127 protein n=1 Tax=Pseudobacter ginsenosidimutans TaxID=661488 RepID=UPI001A916E10|nr:beta-L-arabinofuranosidase domain-containing protein [Pseudobacter ginsenosidimutans]
MKIFFLVLPMLVGSATHAQDSLYHNSFPLKDVRLLGGAFKRARDLNIRVLLAYDADRLLAPFRKEAGLPARASGYPNWEGLDGHVGGHYLSALAMHYAATQNTECKRRMDYMIAELKACQQENARRYPAWGNGYLGGVPNSDTIWSAFRQGNFKAYRAAWVPWYNLHKLYAGLRDVWLYTGNQEAKALFLSFCDWGIDIVAGLTEAQMQSMLDTEHGGMNEVMADAFQMTGKEKYLVAAKRFSHRMLLDPMAKGIDNLDNKHANTQVPKAVGFQRISELCQDSTFKKAGSFFWETVTNNRSVAFGGNSRREFFPAKAACMDMVTDVEGPESCNSNNMLKLTEDLFRVVPSATYMDYYERTLYNHILSTQHPTHGGYVYFTPLRPRHYRVYSAPNQAMWCCVGTGMENHGQYNRLIYTHRQDSLFVNLFAASELDWQEKKIVIRQETNFPEEEHTKLLITSGLSRFTLMVRYPGWMKQGSLKILVNGKNVKYDQHPASYVAIDRTWKKGDIVQVFLPMQNSIEHLPNVPAYIAIMHGPILLGAKTGTENLNGLIANDGRWAHIAGGEKLPVDKAPILVSDTFDQVIHKLQPVKGRPLHFTFPDLKTINPVKIELEPFYGIHDARYMIYWMALSNGQYKGYLDSLAVFEKERMVLEKRTIDFIAPGEQQPEIDHKLLQEGSRSDNTMDAFWREASNGGYFSYQMSTKNEEELILRVRYWGSEWGNRNFEILIDDQRLVIENNTNRWNQSAFFDIEYPIPAGMVKDKEYVRVKFQSLPGTTAGRIYYIRLLKR